MQLKRAVDELYENSMNNNSEDATDFEHPNSLSQSVTASGDGVAATGDLTANKKVKTETSVTGNDIMTTTSPVTINGNGGLNGSLTGSSSPSDNSLASPANVIPGVVANNINNNNQNNNGNHTPAAPSRVVHIRNIPNEANESDLINLSMPFGKVSNIMLLKGKNQAFVEFVDLASAQCVVSYWVMNAVHNQPTVRGRHVFCQFSNHQQLKQNANHTNHVGHDGGHMNGGMQSNGHMSPANKNNGSAQAGETSVVRVVVDSLIYPVTLDTFFQLFSRYGKVNKIVTFTKNNSLQALVQFDSPFSAQTAKTSLDGQAIFGGNSNILRVDYSKLANLNVKYNNDKSRDYTNPLLPAGNAQQPYGGAAPSEMNAGGHHHAGLDPLTLAGILISYF